MLSLGSDLGNNFEGSISRLEGFERVEFLQITSPFTRLLSTLRTLFIAPSWWFSLFDILELAKEEEEEEEVVVYDEDLNEVFDAEHFETDSVLLIPLSPLGRI